MELLKIATRVSSFTLLSRVTGLLREWLIARAFGASGMTDAFFVAFRIPNLLRRLFSEGAFSQAFVPLLAHSKEKSDPATTRSLIEHVAGALSVSLLIAVLVGIIVSPLIIQVVVPGFSVDPSKQALTVEMLRITFPYILLISLSGFGGAILNAWGYFSLPAFIPVLLNLSFIVGIVVWGDYFEPPIKVLAWSVLGGGVLQLGILLWGLYRHQLLPRVRLNWQHSGVREVIGRMLPAMVGVSAGQISLLLNTLFTSYMVVGSLSWLGYADRLMEFPTALLGVALGTVLLPSLSAVAVRIPPRHDSGWEQARGEFSHLIDWGLRLVCLLALPASLGMFLLAIPLTATFYHYGVFGAGDVIATSEALIAYAAGLIGLCAVKVLAPAFYARQDTRTPMLCSLIAIVATQLFNVATVGTYGHVGLAWAISLGAWVNTLLLLGIIWHGGYYRPGLSVVDTLPSVQKQLTEDVSLLAKMGWARFLLCLCLALVLLAAWLHYFCPPALQWLDWQAKPFWRLTVLMGLVGGGMVCYLGCLYLLGFRIRDFRYKNVG